MSWEQLLPPDRVKWERDGRDYYPVWPSEPDVAVIRGIVASALPQEEDDFTVDFLTEGAYHKVYEVSHSAWSTAYIFRIAVAVDPHLKVESEMATLLFINQSTSIPAPKPIAWSSSVHEELGYEWALLEKLPGVGLNDVWDQVPWEKKEEIIDTLAGFLVQLWAPNLRFGSIGSLYPHDTKSSSHHTEKISPEESVDPLKNIDSQEESPPKATVSGTPSHTTEETVSDTPSHTTDETVSDELVNLQVDVSPEGSGCPTKDTLSEISDPTAKESGSEPHGHFTEETGEEIGSREPDKVIKETQSNDSVHPAVEVSSGQSTFPTQETCSQEPAKQTFMVGPMVHDSFWYQRRLHLSSSRGPYGSSHDWLAARIDIEKEYIRTAKVLLENRQDMTPDHKAEDWDTLVEEIGFDERDIAAEYDNMIATCLEFQRVLPLISPQVEIPRHDMRPFVLRHSDLDDRNILVDPETFTITGILDWEQTCIVPDWCGTDYPLLINTSTPVGDGEPPVPTTYDEDSPDYNPVRVSERHRWDCQILRARFDQTVEQLLGTKEWRHLYTKDALRKMFYEATPDIYDNPPRAKNALEWIVGELQALEPAGSQGDQLEHA